MKVSRTASVILAAAILMVHTELESRLVAANNRSVATEWSVQVEKITPGETNLDPAFRIAIYENLLDELDKTGRFKQVFRTGDQRSADLPGLLILKTTVEAYTPGSEARRAVTTVSGATKLKVRSQLCTRAGQVVFDRVLDGNVRFFGGNLRATYNLAHNLANAVKQATLPDPPSIATKNQ
jgi:uncharacterized protein YfcZ (UPF0381/DUF406 family)